MQDEREKGFCASLHIRLFPNVKSYIVRMSDSPKYKPPLRTDYKPLY